MKLKLLLFLLVILIFSCDKGEDECNCDVKIIIVDDGELGQIGSYTITNVPSDCDGNVDVDSLNLASDHWYSNTLNCD